MTGESKWKPLGMNGINSNKIAISVSCLLKFRNENIPFVFSGTWVYISLLLQMLQGKHCFGCFVVDLVAFLFVWATG